MNSPALSGDAADFDPAELMSLPMIADGSEPDLVDKLFDLYLNGTRTLLDTIDRAFREGDREVLLRSVHTIKSSAGRIGARALSVEARRQENLLRAGAAAEADWTARLRERYDRSATALSAYRQAQAHARRKSE
jgi:two-component system, sensor histidine kinase and response regulator